MTPRTTIQDPVHLMGVGGAGMSALAQAMARSGLQVSGCDLAASQALDDVARHGVETLVGHDPSHVRDVGTLVVSAAVPADHPEVQAARSSGIPVLKRAEALGRWVARGNVVAVAGTHGKTTTTAMISRVLEAGGMDPTAFVGGRVAEWGGNLRAGRGNLFVVEADEYDRSFHSLAPDLAVVTNLEPDHLDVYGSEEGVREGFRIFMSKLKETGKAVVCADDPGAASLLAGLEDRAMTYGTSAGSQLRGEAPRSRDGGMECTVVEQGRILGELNIPVPGLHNLRNALAAVTVGRLLGVDFKTIRRGLEGFRGVGRRFDVLGEVGGVTVIDDYAHHPTEVGATLEAARGAFPGRRIVAVFQPHLFSRTRDFAIEFGRALAEADQVWVSDVYPAREAPIPGVTGMLVVDAVLAAGGEVGGYVPELGDLPERLVAALGPGDVCITLGAGSIEQTGPALLERLRLAAPANGGPGGSHA
jgi:UDP-N-acetylmuramate--alanine ligase